MEMVRARGLEPPTLSGPDPKSGVSAIPPRARLPNPGTTLNSLKWGIDIRPFFVFQSPCVPTITSRPAAKGARHSAVKTTIAPQAIRRGRRHASCQLAWFCQNPACFSPDKMTGHAPISRNRSGVKIVVPSTVGEAANLFTRIPRQDLFETNEYLCCLKVWKSGYGGWHPGEQFAA